MLTDLAVELEGADTLRPSFEPASAEVRTPAFGVRFSPGERVGVRGVSGSGKSLLVDAVCGYRQPEGWSVEIDGADIRHLRLAELRSAVQLVKGIEIFHGTIIENVRVGREELSVQSLQSILEQLGIGDQLQSLPDGLNTMLATGGSPLSEGQAQVLMIARAIAGRPRLLIVDETLDHVMDSGERQVITEVLFRRDQPWTLMVVTSREDLLLRCSHILDMPSGAVREVQS